MPQPMMPSGPGRPEVTAGDTPPAPVAPGTGAEGVAAARPRRSRRAKRRRSARELLAAVLGAWPLLVVLAVQAALSVRLLWADTAFQDEATYLWAGHLELAHWLHGAPIPPFPTFFSGAPVVYPPL